MARALFGTLFILCISSFVVHAQIFEFESSIQPESSFSINGTSNVTNISCSYLSPFPSTTLSHQSELSDSVFQVKGDTLFLSIKALECGKRAINRDMRRTLKQGDYPYIKSWIDRITINDEGISTAVVSVFLAGVVNEYEMIIQNEDSVDILQINGAQEIKLSDFGLKAPTVLFGMIKVRDEFNVIFDLYMRQKIRIKKKGS